MNVQTALVTGASSGIGYELAKLFAQDGYNLVLVSRNTDRLHEIATEFKTQFGLSEITVVGKDLSQPDAPQQVYDEVKGQGIAVNVLVNNAGAGEHGMFATETDLGKELSIIQLNATSLVHLTKLFLKDMTERNEGKILMLASVASVLPNPLMAVYGATKAFILNFSEALRNELKDTAITVTALMPGATNTDFFHKAGAEGTVAHQQALKTDAAGVAKDGYEALMKGKDKVVSGMMNKAQVAMSHVMPDSLVTANVRKMMERPSNGNGHHESMTKKQVTTGSLVASLLVLGLVGWVYYNRVRAGETDLRNLFG
ncbi:MAG: SDR family oxidoreductase [Sphingobacteriaceae bacterium]|nr:SDR family oxidoreductase [Cytophagaceae bacterium]